MRAAIVVPTSMSGQPHHCRLPIECRPHLSADVESIAGRIIELSHDNIRIVIGRRFEVGALLNVQIQCALTADEASFLAMVIQVGAKTEIGWFIECQFAPELGEAELQSLLDCSEPVS